jgi:hypothetical protein
MANMWELTAAQRNYLLSPTSDQGESKKGPAKKKKGPTYSIAQMQAMTDRSVDLGLIRIEDDGESTTT